MASSSPRPVAGSSPGTSPSQISRGSAPKAATDVPGVSRTLNLSEDCVVLPLTAEELKKLEQRNRAASLANTRSGATGRQAVASPTPQRTTPSPGNTPNRLKPQSPGLTRGADTPNANPAGQKNSPGAEGYDEESEDDDEYDERVEQRVRLFLDAQSNVTAVLNPCPSIEEDDRAQLEKQLRFTTREVLRQQLLDTHEELILTLNDWLVLEAKANDLDDEVAYLEHKVGEKEEKVEMLQIQLSSAEENAESLMREKTEALRKLSEAKSELAMMSTRSVKLQQQLEQSVGNSNYPTLGDRGSDRSGRAGSTKSGSVATATSSVPRPTPLGGSGSYLSNVEHSAIVDKLRKEAEEAKQLACRLQKELTRTQAQLEQQRERAAEPAAVTAAAASSSPSPAGGARGSGDDSPGMAAGQGTSGLSAGGGGAVVHVLGAGEDKVAEEPSLTHSILSAQEEAQAQRRCEVLQQRVTSLEKEIDLLRAASGKGEEDAHSASGAGQQLAAKSARLSPETQLALVTQQLKRAQADTVRLERELAIGREKALKQGKIESKLLADIAQLSRQLRTRETQDRDARQYRRLDNSLTRDQAMAEASGRASKTPVEMKEGAGVSVVAALRSSRAVASADPVSSSARDSGRASSGILDAGGLSSQPSAESARAAGGRDDHENSRERERYAGIVRALESIKRREAARKQSQSASLPSASTNTANESAGAAVSTTTSPSLTAMGTKEASPPSLAPQLQTTTTTTIIGNNTTTTTMTTATTSANGTTLKTPASSGVFGSPRSMTGSARAAIVAASANGSASATVAAKSASSPRGEARESRPATRPTTLLSSPRTSTPSKSRPAPSKDSPRRPCSTRSPTLREASPRTPSKPTALSVDSLIQRTADVAERSPSPRHVPLRNSLSTLPYTDPLSGGPSALLRKSPSAFVSPRRPQCEGEDQAQQQQQQPAASPDQLNKQASLSLSSAKDDTVLKAASPSNGGLQPRSPQNTATTTPNHTTLLASSPATNNGSDGGGGTGGGGGRKAPVVLKANPSAVTANAAVPTPTAGVFSLSTPNATGLSPRTTTNTPHAVPLSAAGASRSGSSSFPNVAQTHSCSRRPSTAVRKEMKTLPTSETSA